MNEADLALALKKCEAEPIHLIGSIQPHGVLLVVGPAPEHLILQASRNAETLLGRPLAGLLNYPLPTLLEPEQIEVLCNPSEKPGGEGLSGELVYAVVNDEIRQFLALPHHAAPLTLLELEPHDKPYQPKDILRLQAQAHDGIMCLQHQDDLQKTLDTLASLIQHLTSYHHVMVYRFDSNWEGEVVAEKRHDENTVAYLGHRFPAGDIPPQARELYRRHPLRLVVDTEALPSPLSPPCNPLTAAGSRAARAPASGR